MWLKSMKKCDRESVHRQTHTRTHGQTQNDFIICPMLYAIAMGQIINCIIGMLTWLLMVSWCIKHQVWLHVSLLIWQSRSWLKWAYTIVHSMHEIKIVADRRAMHSVEMKTSAIPESERVSSGDTLQTLMVCSISSFLTHIWFNIFYHIRCGCCGTYG